MKNTMQTYLNCPPTVENHQQPNKKLENLKNYFSKLKITSKFKRPTFETESRDKKATNHISMKKSVKYDLVREFCSLKMSSKIGKRLEQSCQKNRQEKYTQATFSTQKCELVLVFAKGLIKQSQQADYLKASLKIGIF